MVNGGKCDRVVIEFYSNTVNDSDNFKLEIKASLNYLFSRCLNCTTFEEIFNLLLINSYINPYVGFYYFNVPKNDQEEIPEQNLSDVWLQYNSNESSIQYLYGIPINKGRTDTYFFRICYADKDINGNIKVFMYSPLEFILCKCKDLNYNYNKLARELYDSTKSPIFKITRSIHPLNIDNITKIIGLKLV